MKMHISLISALALSVGCSKGLDTKESDGLLMGADTGNQANLVGNWIQECQSGAFTGGGLAAIQGSNGNGSEDETPEVPPRNLIAGAERGDQDKEKGEGEAQDPKQDQSQEQSGDPDNGENPDDGGDSGAQQSVQNHLNITADTMTLQTHGFDQSSCAGEESIEAKVVMSYVFPNYAEGQMTDLNLTLQSAEATVKTESAIEDANQAKLCGFSDWKLNEPKQIMGTTCLQGMPAQANQQIFQTLQFQNDQLFLGTTNTGEDGSNEENRPSTVGTIPFQRDQPSSENPDEGENEDESGDGTGEGEGETEDGGDTGDMPTP